MPNGSEPVKFDVSIQIDRPLDQVFAYVVDESNMARWNSAVQSVRQTSSEPTGVGATYHMVRQLPTGPSYPWQRQ